MAMVSADDVRAEIYSAIVHSGRAPTPADVAKQFGVDEREVADLYRALASAHVVVLRPGIIEIAWAPPFSVVPTAFRTTVGSMTWSAPCAWDAFGIPAALKRDATIDARCAWSNEPIACGVSAGVAYGEGVIHLLVPAARFWDDIAYT
jgi:hypothetical protein